jgi:hypothetical protein
MERFDRRVLGSLPKVILPLISTAVLFASVGSVVRRRRVVRWNLVLSALQFGLFIMFWTALTFLLSSARPPTRR